MYRVACLLLMPFLWVGSGGAIRKSCFALPKQARPSSLRPAEKGYLVFEWKRSIP